MTEMAPEVPLPDEDLPEPEPFNLRCTGETEGPKLGIHIETPSGVKVDITMPDRGEEQQWLEFQGALTGIPNAAYQVIDAILQQQNKRRGGDHDG